MPAAQLPQVDGLEAYWARFGEHRADPTANHIADRLLLDTLGLGNQEVLRFLLNDRPDFETFRCWIVETAGQPDPLLLDRYHAHRQGRSVSPKAQATLDAIDAMPPVLDAADLATWDDTGIVVLRSAITAHQAATAATFVWDAAQATPGDPASWYRASVDGIMIPHYHHPSLTAARTSPRIHKAFAQLWGRADLWMLIDLVGFNPPVTAHRGFRGSPLHWDVSLARPIPFATQAVLYLTDTAADQGAFRAVPGFHRRIDGWLDNFGDTDPRSVDLSAEAVTIPGRAGDLIIWRQDLPHGASPNRAATPRLVQYLTMYPPDLVAHDEWR